jgi:outer membrane protein TolC
MKTRIAVAVMALAAAAAAAADAPTLTIQEAVDKAIAGGDDIRIANGGLDAAKAANDQALSKAGITLSGSGSYSLTDAFGKDLRATTGSGSPTPTASSLSGMVGKAGASQSLQGGLSLSAGNASASSPYTRVGLTVTQNLPPPPSAPSTLLGLSLAQTVWDGYPGGQTKAAVDKAALAYQAKGLAAIQARSTITANVKKAYVTMLTAQRNLALRSGVLAKQAALLKQIQATFALKQASAIDLMTAQINERGAELDLETAKHDLALAQQRLAIIMGMPPDSDFTVAEIVEPALPAPSIDEAVKIGLAKRSDAAQIQLSRRSSSIDLALAKALSQPGVSATGGFNLGMVQGGAPGTAASANIGVKVALPVLDAGAADSQTAAVAAQLAIYETQAAQLAKTIAADIRDAYWSATILYDRIALAKQTQDMNDNQLALVQAQFQFGTATTQDVLTAQVNSANAAAAYLAAKGAYLLQELTLETAMGL